MKSEVSDDSTYQDPSIENKDWSCKNYTKDMNNDGEALNRDVYSKGRQDSLKLVYQKDQIIEFMKILGLAHMCVAENFTDKEGNV